MNFTSVRVVWQWTRSSPGPSCFNTTTVTYHPEGGGGSSLQLSNPVATETTLTDLQCNTNYTITVVATAGEHERRSVARTVFVPLQGILHHIHLCIKAIWKLYHLSILDTPVPVGVRAEVTANNTSIRVSWQWSRKDVLMCVDLVNITVHYRPEGGSLMMYTVDNTTVTSATLPNLQCNTQYTVWVYVASGRSHVTGNTNASRMVSLPARGTYIMYVTFYTVYYTLYYSSPSHSH